MPISTKILDQRIKRDSARRQRVLNRRAAEQDEAAREELRRLEAVEEAKAFAAELDAKAEKRRQSLVDLRAKARREKDAAARVARRTATEDLIAQVARRREQAHTALQQQKENEKERSVRKNQSHNRILQAAAELRQLRQLPQPDKQEHREAPRSTPDPVRSKRMQEQLTIERAARRAAAVRSQQTAAREMEQRRQENAQALKETGRDEAVQHRKEERRARDAVASKRLRMRAETAGVQRVEKKTLEHDADTRLQRLVGQSKERANLEKRRGRLLELREQRQIDRRDREGLDVRRRESLAAIRAQAVRTIREARSADVGDAAKDRNDASRKPVRPVLVDPRPQSVLSASLPWLKIAGNSLVTLVGDRVILRGITLPGWDGADADIEQLIGALSGWGATIVRIPLCQRSVTHDDGSYCRLLDRIISAAAAGGAYTSLALCTVDDSSVFGSTSRGEPCYWPPMPGGDSIGMWRLLAQRYQNEPAVLFELFTAPHTALTDDISGVDYRVDRYSTWCQMTIAELRSYAPAAVCLVAAAQYGTDTTVLPVAGTAGEPIPGVVYTVHAAPSRPLDWSAVRGLSRKRPVMVSEWTGTENDLLWATRIAVELRGLGIGFCGGGAFFPPLYTQRGSGVVPTRMGMLIKRELARSEELTVPSVSIVPDSFFIQSFSDEGGNP